MVVLTGTAASPSAARIPSRSAGTGTARTLSESSLGPALRLRGLPGGARRALRELVAPALRSTSAARADETPCGDTPGLLCSQVDVPLDYSGVVPATISLHVERLPAPGVPRGVMFLIAGGPGQGSARSFDLGTPANAALFRFVFPGYTLVAYDDRGTGASGLLRCPTLENAYPVESEAIAAATCADAIGPTRDFYSTLDHTADPVSYTHLTLPTNREV